MEDVAAIKPTNFFRDQTAPRTYNQANQTPLVGQKENSPEDSFSNDYQSFLRLLVAQLEHQDPMAPTDPTQFMSQLAQFSTVEQQITTNANLEAMMSHLSSSVDRLDLVYLGREVEAVTNIIGLSEGNPARFSYALDSNAETSDIHIINEHGDIVHSFSGELTVGRHDVVWDGKDASGRPVPDGIYRVQVVAHDEEEKAIDTSMVVQDSVKEVAKINGQTWLMLQSGNQITPEAVIKVTEPLAPPPVEEEAAA